MIEYSDFVRQYLTVAIFAGVGIGLGAGLLDHAVNDEPLEFRIGRTPADQHDGIKVALGKNLNNPIAPPGAGADALLKQRTAAWRVCKVGHCLVDRRFVVLL